MNQKQKLENKIEETIRILSNMHPEDQDLKKYQGVLKSQTEEYKIKFNEDYVRSQDF